MANVRAVLAKGFSVAVVVVLAAIGGYVLVGGGFDAEGLLVYLLTLSFAVASASGIWTDRYRVALVGTVGIVVLALAVLQSPFLFGLAALLAVALVLAWSGRAREQLS